MDKILIRDLSARGIIGINDWEREKRVLDNGNAIFIHTCACKYEQPPTDVIINAIVEAGSDVEESRESGNELLSN